MTRPLSARIALAAAVLALWSSGSALAGDDTARFRALVDDYYAAWNSGDVSKAAAFYAKDPGLVFYDIMPFEYRGWDAYARGANDLFFASTLSARLTPHGDLQVTRRGRVAWTTTGFHLSAQFKDGRSLELDARHTAVWELRGGKWLVVHEHVSVPLPG